MTDDVSRGDTWPGPWPHPQDRCGMVSDGGKGWQCALPDGHDGLAFIAELRGGGSDHRSILDPLATVTVVAEALGVMA